MSKNLNLDAMSTDEMWQLHEEISRILSVKLASEKRELEKRLAQLRKEKETPQLEAEDRQLKETRSERRKYPTVLPKYQNPDEPSETWSGRGKQPRWLTAALSNGHTIQDFVIGNIGLNKGKSRRQLA
jgi:DNA-binding protein H-NS